MIITTEPDKKKADSLTNMAIITLERLKETEIEKYPTNTLTDYYDIIRKLMEALTCLEGIKVKGEGAHAVIIDYVCDKYSLDYSTKQFLQEMRDYRNRISYEGFNIKESYIKSNIKRIDKFISLLLNIIKKKRQDDYHHPDQSPGGS